MAGTVSQTYPQHLPPPGTPLTEAEFARLRGEGWRLELVDGRLQAMAPAGWQHGEICMWIGTLLLQWVKAAPGRGSVIGTDSGVKLHEGCVRAPDVMWISDEARARALRSGESFLPGAPDLAIEVLSPSDSYAETIERVQDQLTHGCKQVWLVEPRKRWVEIHTPGRAVQRLNERATLDGGDLLPGFRHQVSELFPQ